MENRKKKGRMKNLAKKRDANFREIDSRKNLIFVHKIWKNTRNDASFSKHPFRLYLLSRIS